MLRSIGKNVSFRSDTKGLPHANIPHCICKHRQYFVQTNLFAVSRQRIIVNQISDFNENIYTAIIDLRERMEQVEQENIRLRSMLVDNNRYGRYRDAMRTGFRGTTDDRSRSPSRDPNPAVEIPGKDKKRDAAARFSQKLKLQIGGEVAGLVPSSAALPTPLTLVSQINTSI